MPRWSYWIDFVVYPIAALALVLLTFRSWQWLGWFCYGALLFSLFEYGIHCVVLHHIYTEQHATHHNNPHTYVAVPWYSSFVITALLMLFMPWGMLCGAFVMYSVYCYVHHYAHHKSSYYWPGLMERLCHNHQIHHVLGNVNFGVSSPLFDFVFGTYKHHRS